MAKKRFEIKWNEHGSQETWERTAKMATGEARELSILFDDLVENGLVASYNIKEYPMPTEDFDFHSVKGHLRLRYGAKMLALNIPAFVED